MFVINNSIPSESSMTPWRLKIEKYWTEKTALVQNEDLKINQLKLQQEEKEAER